MTKKTPTVPMVAARTLKLQSTGKTVRKDEAFSATPQDARDLEKSGAALPKTAAAKPVAKDG
ncbi:hypothetical protein N0B44_15595 [Roseibacterium beibuensis]|uniref:Uncharacterized protein n=1 Tax=[Roseibacterium] beibuensis TaxID=1193142 RepID=A0ABP9L8U6_9RHOB|nr:hypothetical protein [Roseibacterium beibuensis]MCS6624343.1 hypothetical protein [Roseibacterium beibuensis]